MFLYFYFFPFALAEEDDGNYGNSTFGYGNGHINTFGPQVQHLGKHIGQRYLECPEAEEVEES